MIRLLARQIPSLTLALQSRISVYQGISPSLLATMSLSQGIKGNTHEQLVNSLVKGNAIRNKLMIEAMRKYDMKLFIAEETNKGSCYENRPYKLWGGQCMTDIFTHAVELEAIGEWIGDEVKRGGMKQRNGFRVLDIGTGHGYIAFILSSFISSILNQNSLSLPQKIIAIDSNQKAIEYSKALQQKLLKQQNYSEVKNIQFRLSSFEEAIEKESYDMVIGGFYLPPAYSDKAMDMMKKTVVGSGRAGFGIWPADSTSGQSLYSFTFTPQKDNPKQVKVSRNEIMSTMFSMPVVNTKVSQYFIEDHQKDQPQLQSQPAHSQDELRQSLIKAKLAKKAQQNKELKQKLKQAIEKHGNLLNKKLTLAEMKTIPEISQLLGKLNGK